VTSGSVVLIVAVFLASCVEMVEALTIIVAAGVSRGWRSALEGAGAAIVVLAVLVAALGPALVHLVPLNSLRAVIGGVLLAFGLQWLRKAVLRATGYKAKHDENAIFTAQVAAMKAQGPTSGSRDSVGFGVAFKGVFLEGIEVVIVVLTLGAPQHRLELASVAAAAALVLVTGVGVIVARQLDRVPENAMKMGVGLMLVSFGSFWTGEGLGVHWPGADLALPVLVGVYAAAVLVIVRLLKSTDARLGAGKGRRVQIT
jgi:Ca2+/H+ antiporter, TMEM165/GDT1 family